MKQQLKHDHLTIPIELISYAFANKITKQLAAYVVLKFYSDGMLTENIALSVASYALKIDRRTVKQYFKKLIAKNWIGYDPNAKIYFIRSFDFIIKQQSFQKRHAAKCFPEDLENINAFFVGAIISKELNVMKYLNVMRTRKGKVVVDKGNAAFQPYSMRPTHLGLSNGIIAKILGCKYTRASELKKEAVENGYLKASHKYSFVSHDLKADFNLKAYLPDIDKQAGRFKLRVDSNGYLNLVKQEYDEMEPLVSITNRKKRTPYEKRRKRDHKLTA